MIMVDELRPWPHARGVFASGACHLTVDGESDEHLQALHAFAASIGLRRSWFQPRSVPHYDLTKSKRGEALAAGAVFVGAGHGEVGQEAWTGMTAGVNAWLARECPSCKAPPGHDCKPDRGDGAIHGQRTAGPCYPHGRPSAEQLAALEARRAARRAALAGPSSPARVEPEQLTLGIAEHP